MKTIYLECNMGAAGDMLMAALLELHDDPQGFLRRLNAVGIPGVVVTAGPSVKCGITGTCVKVAVGGREENCHDGYHHDDHHHDDHHHDDHDHHHYNDHHHGDHDHHHDDDHHHADDPHHHDDHQRHHHRKNNNAHHHHSSFHDIEHIINHLNISDNVKKNALEVYRLIAEAESHVHGVSVDRIHFHEVGEMDAIADITGACMLIEELSPDAILSSPINTGSGHVHCAHGILPVPAPAAAHVLRGIPVYNDGVTQSELCTPTGAALLKHFTQEFCPMPPMAVDKIGYGMGKKDFEKANCVRAYIGRLIDTDVRNVRNVPNVLNKDNPNKPNEKITELTCNLDDMTPESVAFAQELLLHEGALDVWTTPIGMKKGRLGVMFFCLCSNDMKDKMVSLIFKHTTTLGIRENICHRYALPREQSEINTEYGTVRIKTAHGFGVTKSKPEHDDIAKIARERNISIQDVLKAITATPTAQAAQPSDCSPTPTAPPSRK